MASVVPQHFSLCQRSVRAPITSQASADLQSCPVVPWMWLLNGVNSTTFAGSWTLVNAHEVAIVSGLAAAYRLGASYPEDLEADGFAYTAFKAYTFLTHGRWHKKGENRQ